MATTVRGHIEQLPSGSFRVHVYAGTVAGSRDCYLFPNCAWRAPR